MSPLRRQMNKKALSSIAAGKFSCDYKGVHTYHVDTVLSNGKVVSSIEQQITYSPIGPWVTIDNFTYGDFAVNRPYIRGQAGYSISEDELLFSKTKEATAEQKAATAAKKVAKIELSFDNGKTFTQLSKNEKWMYRIENQDIAEGYHFFLIRATMQNGEVAITRTIVQIDNKANSDAPQKRKSKYKPWMNEGIS